MKLSEFRRSADEVVRLSKTLCEITDTATRNGKSLAGRNHYADKFHALVVSIGKLELAIESASLEAGLDESERMSLSVLIEQITQEKISPAERTIAARQLEKLLATRIVPALERSDAPSAPVTERVLPLAVVENTRSYLRNIVLQANGCYERGWYDACAVMIRKLVETLIIEVYEQNNCAQRIKSGNGDFFALSDLIGAVLSDTSWNLGRETKVALPKVKELGDRAAHNRRFMAKKPDVDGLIGGLRVVADDLLHIAKLK